MTLVETAKAVRADLRAKWPGRKFSVTCSPGCSVNVRWVDGPTVEQVEAVAGKHERVRRDDQGEILGGGNIFVSAARTLSDRVKAFVSAETLRRYGAPPNPWEQSTLEYRVSRGVEVRLDGQILAWNPERRREPRPRLALVQGGAR